MRRFAAVVLASSLLASSAFAQGNDAPLPAGKPAGVKQANLAGNGLLVLFGLAIVGGGIALVASSGSGNAITTSTTGTAP